MSKQCKQCGAPISGAGRMGLCRPCAGAVISKSKKWDRAHDRADMPEPSIPRLKWLEREMPE
jgi:hypothetical protein